ncbi:MAG: NAD(P)-dependent oxidoreductase [Reichenbachiella sp.]|uniref:NAD-dependent epimerase/dehydratase family protein n=1 Tax=Reichenbachiella sp. TaxID=2184521 RepID=UPI002966F6EA|nr:NAD(P)-dependent oxidoreductase [Reichenbachiella sp.]MDW3208247.1 NAD(P)-dependent oxidoreductase [Reichenbachiella sp.]
MKILITGGSGFIGTHLIKSLFSLKGEISILNVDLNNSPILHPHLKTVITDIRSNNLHNILAESSDFDQCIHLAAICKEPGYEWKEYFETNHVGTKNIISLCDKLNIPKIIFTSTMMVYKAGEEQKTELSQTDPDTAYGISKLLAEKELEKWKYRGTDRELKIIRPAVVFGENENANFTRLYKSLKKGFFPYVGKKTTIKSNIYVHELNSFIIFLMTKPTKSNIYNFGFPELSSINHITSTFNEVFGIKAFRPTIPLRIMILLAHFFQLLNRFGFKNSIHPRRIEKLYYSTDIYPKAALDEGYQFKFNLSSALEDWKKSDDINM